MAGRTKSRMSERMSTAKSDAADAAPLFAALGDPTRLALVQRLSNGEAASIAVLSADTSLTRQAVTKHLSILEQVGFVERMRVGRESRYAFRPTSAQAAQAYLAKVSARWDASLERLRALVENET